MVVAMLTDTGVTPSGSKAQFSGEVAGAVTSQVRPSMFCSTSQPRRPPLPLLPGRRRPIVHFRVDVRRVVAAPRRVQKLVPKALQIGRLRTPAGTGDQKIAPV